MRAFVPAMIGIACSAAAFADTGSATTARMSGASEDNRIYCRKRVETGSLVRKVKQCFTKAEWEKIAESQQRSYLRLRDTGSGQ